MDKQTKVLLVGSVEGDYGVLSFNDYNDENSLSLKDWVERLENTELKKEIVEEDDYYFSVELFTFGEIDTNFIKFIQNEIVDYDNTKNTDFFVVEE